MSLRVSCQTSVGHPASQPGLRLDGTENQASYWGEAVSVEYAGRAGDPLTYELSKTSTPTPGACKPYGDYAKVILFCNEGRVDALEAGAVLVAARGETIRARWKPASRQAIHALRCDLVEQGAAPPVHDADNYHDHQLVFAARSPHAAGIEWADENSDMVAQNAAYRLLPTP